VHRTNESLFQNWLIYLSHLLRDDWTIDTNHNAIGVEEIFYRRSLSKKFRIGNNVESKSTAAVQRKVPLELLACLYWDSALFDYKPVTSSVPHNHTSNIFDCGKIRPSSVKRGGADTNEDGTCTHDSILRTGKVQTTAGSICLNYTCQMRLKERKLAVLKQVQFSKVAIGAENVVPYFG